MADARVLLAFAALLVLALFYIERGMNPAFAPFSAVGSAALFVSLFGCLGLLRLGGWLFYLFCLCAAGWLCWRWVVKKAALPRLGFGFWFFAVCGLGIILLLWARQPMFTTWDEFSLWGTAGKLMKLYDEFYTTAPVGWIWNQPQTPVMMTTGYIFQFFGEGFLEWQTYAAYDVFQLAAMAAVLAPLNRKNWNVLLPVGVICLLTPFIFQHYMSAFKISEVYLTSLADLPLGLCFGAALCCWFGAEGRSLKNMVPVAIALATLTLIKDTGMALGLVVCVLVLIDELFAKRAEKPALKKRLGGAAARFGIAAGAVLAAFLGWAAYTGSATGVNRFESLGGKYDVSMLQMPMFYLQDLFASPHSDFFAEVNWGMRYRFFHLPNTMLGAGVRVVLVILAMLAVAAVVTRDGTQRRRCLLFGVFSTLGFAAYHLFITMTYLYIFRPEQALVYESYERYIYPYYIGWLLCAVLLLAKSALWGGAQAEAQKDKGARGVWNALRPALGKAVLFGLCGVMLLRMAQLMPAHYTVLGVNSDEYNERRAFAARMDELAERLAPDGRTYYINTIDDGQGWFATCYELLPWQLDYSFGGGPFERKDIKTDGTTDKHILDVDEWADYLLETGCTTVYIEHADEAFRKAYGSLFADDMQAYFDRETDLYKVEVAADGVSLVPIASEV